jgi:hypothetical protein
MAALDTTLMFLSDPFVWAHDGFHDGEIPRYAECRYGCGHLVRADRTDLLSEHHQVCPNFPRNATKRIKRSGHQPVSLVSPSAMLLH